MPFRTSILGGGGRLPDEALLSGGISMTSGAALSVDTMQRRTARETVERAADELSLSFSLRPQAQLQTM